MGNKNLIISFFATWCVPCKKEIPELIKLSKQFKEDFEFVLIDVNEKKEKVQKHVEDNNITLQVILDKYGRVFKSYGGETLPLLVVIDKQGKISYYHTGYQKGDEISRQTFKKLMRKISFLFFILSSLNAQLTVSILDFKGTDVKNKVLRACYNQLEESLIESNRFTVIDKSQREELLEEQQFQNSGVCDEECAVEIGQLVGAEFLMLGEIIDLGGLYQINIKIISIEKGDVAEKVTNQIEGKLKDLLNGMEDASREIVRRIASSSGALPIDREPIQQTLQSDDIKTYGQVEIITDPVGTNVLIDGLESGTTPLTLDKIESGVHSLILSYPGYERLQKRIMIKEGELLSVNEYLVPMTGSLTILSEPTGAIVYLDNTQKGITPLDIKDLPIKDYIVELSLKDYQKSTKRFTVQYGENTTQKISLKPLPGKLNLFTNPIESTITINRKKYKSNTQGILSVEIPVGRYDIVASKKARYEDFRKNIYVKANSLETIDVFLKKLPEGVSSNPDMGFLSVNTFNGETKLKIPGEKEIQRLPLRYYELKYGKYNLKAFGEGLESKNFKVEVDRQKQLTLILILKEKAKSKALKYSLMFPGAGQFYEGSKRSILYSSAFIGAGVLLFNNLTSYSDEKALLDQYRLNYQSATSSSDIDASWLLYEQQSNKLNDVQSNLIILSSTLASAWLSSVIDTYFFRVLNDQKIITLPCNLFLLQL